ncbi:helix-turn-helix domain-containing protein [Lucifera butyrica]|nr:helix-turn-helix domain-containing protein [Lucifera butyrica]
MSITIPPLRNRIEDIPLLFRYFLEKISRDRAMQFSTEPEVMEWLKKYNWPGNVRELQNVVERAASLAENDTITLRHLPVDFYAPSFYSASPPAAPAADLLNCREQRRMLAQDAEKHKILSLLNLHAGNVSQVARELGVSRKTLYNKMRVYAIRN